MHFRCHLGVPLGSTDKEFFENHLVFKLTDFCVVIENVHCCAILACVNMGGLDTKSLILCFDLVWCHHTSQQRFLSGLLAASCLPRLEISFNGGLWCLFPAERDL